MALNISHAEDVFLNARTRFEEWKEAFMQEWYRPLAEMQLGMLMESMPEEEKARMRELYPEVFEKMEEMTGDMKARGGA